MTREIAAVVIERKKGGEKKRMKRTNMKMTEEDIEIKKMVQEVKRKVEETEKIQTSRVVRGEIVMKERGRKKETGRKMIEEDIKKNEVKRRVESTEKMKWNQVAGGKIVMKEIKITREERRVIEGKMTRKIMRLKDKEGKMKEDVKEMKEAEIKKREKGDEIKKQMNAIKMAEERRMNIARKDLRRIERKREKDMMELKMMREKEEERSMKDGKQEKTIMVKVMIKTGEEKIRKDQRRISRADIDDEKMDNEGRRKDMTRYTVQLDFDSILSPIQTSSRCWTMLNEHFKQCRTHFNIFQHDPTLCSNEANNMRVHSN
jgi:hypothetical protein